MSQHELLVTYITALFGRFCDDERGSMAETIVITGVALVATAAVALIIWQKLKGGASGIDVPSPQAP